MRKHIVIGAGPAGISAAWKLAKEGEEVLVIEAGNRVGGMAQTFQREDCLLEYGPHAFHIKEKYITELTKSLCGENFRIIPTKTHIILRNKYFKYPLEFYDVLFGLNPILSSKMLLDYLATTIKNGLRPQPDVSFESWGIKHFGKTLYELCFGQYTQKVWGITPSKLSYKLAQQKLHKLNLRDILHKLFGGKGEEQKAYFKSYIYPKYGVGEIFAQMAEEIQARYGKILLNSIVTDLELGKSGIKIVRYQDKQSNKAESVGCSTVVSTMPLGSLVQSIRPVMKEKILDAGQHLVFRDLVLVYFIIDQDYVTQSQWVYLVDERFRFNRFTEQKNLSPYMFPSNKTVIMFEICCSKGDHLWRSNDSLLFNLAMEEVRKLKLFNEKQVLDRFVIRLENAYPIYDLEFDSHVNIVINELSKIPNLISTGRNGLFLNTDIHDSVEMGLLAGEQAKKSSESADWYQKMDEYVKEKLER